MDTNRFNLVLSELKVFQEKKLIPITGNRLRRLIGKRHRWPEGGTRPWITRQCRRTAVADRVKALDDMTILVQDLRIGSDYHSALGAKVTRVNLHRVIRWPVNGSKAGVRRHARIAVVAVVR